MTNQAFEADQRVDALPFYIAGIGASAGGLEALQAFFGECEPGQGIAYVVVQHLSPDFKSMMAELLGRHTRLTVREVVDGSVPAPDTVFLIPPRQTLVLEKGKLLRTERDMTAPSFPINLFLESLAREQGERCAAVILSGTGTDGTQGVRLIREAGGVVLTQDASSARFDGMPSSVVQAGLSDFVGPPEQLARRLVAHVKSPVLVARDESQPPDADVAVLDDIVRLLRQRAQYDFSAYKRGTALRRIRRRSSLVGQSSLAGYLSLLRNDDREADYLVRELLIGVTQFFRDPDAWQVLETSVIPELVHNAEAHSTVRMWVAGCATGEEAYTLAMLVQEQLSRVDRPINYRLFATDARRDALTVAREGRYPMAACLSIPEPLRDKYVDQSGDACVIKRVLRDAITFATHDVLTDPPFTQLDLLSCRNLLIYFSAEAQHRVFARFRMAIKKGGYLFLGGSESVGEANPQFRALHGAGNLYVARGTPSIERALAWTHLRERQPHDGPDARRVPFTALTEELYKAALRAYVPPGVAVDEHFELLQVFGSVGEYVNVPAGRATVNLLRMVPRPVGVLLNSAGRKALSRHEEVRISDVALRAGDASGISLRILPVEDLPSGTRQLLIFFEDQAPVSSVGLTADLDEATRQRTKELEDELIVARESLHSAVQDLEATNEELQSTNEELAASNEELQSTNEELQSVNEELYTVNSEYQQKIGELEELNDDLENVLHAIEAGVLFLDDALTIRRFNETARRLLPLRHEDLGRPLQDIAPHPHYPEMVDHAKQVLETNERLGTTVVSAEGAWWRVGMRNFQVPHGSRRGLIITMQEVTELTQAISELSRLTRAHEMAEDISGAGHAILDLSNEAVHYSGGARTLLHLGEQEQVPLSTALEMFRPDSKQSAQEAVELLKQGLEIPFTAIRRLRLPDGGEVKVRMQVQGRVDPVTDARLMFAVFQQVP